VSWDDERSPGEATLDWHRQARERDEQYLAQGPVDDSESDDPWRGGPNPPFDD